MKRRHAIGYALVLALGAGCSLIVSADVEDFQCSGTDPSACPTGMTCSASGRCVSGEGGIDPVDSGEDGEPFEDVVDAGRDADAGPQDLGSKCRVDNDCKSRLCGSSTILTTTIAPASSGPICTTPCCTSSDCPSSFVCFNGGTGGGYCVPAATAKRMPPASGGKSGGATCAIDSECRSGLCDKPDGGTARCFDTCCTDANCTGSSVLCRIKSVSAPGPAHDVFVCGTPEPGATKVPGAPCGANSECLNDNCVGFPRACQPSCASAATCKTVSGFSDGHCLYGFSTGDNYRFCKPTTNTSLLAKGAACGDNLDCQSDYCDKETGKCLNVCGKDSDCAANESCRPSASSTPYLRCVPKP